jgi:hypothetical protein
MTPQPIESEHRQHRGDEDSERVHRDDDLRQADGQQDHAYGGGVTESDRRERAPDAARAASLHAERHGEQPSHAGIDAVIRAEKDHRVPIHDSAS